MQNTENFYIFLNRINRILTENKHFYKRYEQNKEKILRKTVIGT